MKDGLLSEHHYEMYPIFGCEKKINLLILLTIQEQP